MPTYAYACTECDHAFDAVQRFTDDALTTCPECSGRLRKVYGSVGVTFKGSGFYRTDSRASASSSHMPAASGSGSRKPVAAASAGSGSESSSSSTPKAAAP